MIKKKIISALAMVLISSALFAQSYGFKVSNELPAPEQTLKARQLYKDLASLTNLDFGPIISIHTEVIEKCPSTPLAQESCWKLSNLYMYGMIPEDYESAVVCLEHLINQYPDSPLVNAASKRLALCYKETGDYEKLCVHYEGVLNSIPQEDEINYMLAALNYAKALQNCGREEEAASYFQSIINTDAGRNTIAARAANKYLQILQNR